MKVNLNKYNNKINFGWDDLGHKFSTRMALKDMDGYTDFDKTRIIEHSPDPDFMLKERADAGARHFYDALFEDPSFGTINDDKNNALSGFINHTNEAIEAGKKSDRDLFTLKLAHAVHYLQDGATPPHTEHGNYFHKLFRLFMHLQFEQGKRFGASSRLDIIEKNYIYERLPVSSLEALFHNTALYTVQPENHVSYTNINSWLGIQQRCLNRAINSSRAYFEFMLKYLPKR